ncbi:dTDP-4-dehydrorhamnose reductase [Aureimonas psammosilenae]|uniref:dTDP-4-dehydrorhamnose reductase n=1 Tax=Aureimonas psammosilenae TaxID=2495496 RepID=UPI001260BB48|nr:dTDP-4-dehydrorhamnose reductase [Aureimonas psammosilenae]
MRILVTGREGQVARALAGLASPEIAVEALGRPDLDIRDPASVARAIAAFAPDVVVSAAAYTAVDKAETEEAEAFAVNEGGAANVSRAAAQAGLPVIHLSTDYVFPGDANRPYREDDPTGPAGVYGRSKLAGEIAVAKVNPRHVILRTAWVFAPEGNNFPRTMLRLAGDRDTVRVVADQQGTPTYAPDIAEAILTVARVALASPDSENWRGTFHMTGTGQTTWAGFAAAVFAASAARGGPSATVEPITTADYPTPARRPAYSVLDNSRFAATFAHALPDWEDATRRFAERAVPAAKA